MIWAPIGHDNVHYPRLVIEQNEHYHDSWAPSRLISCMVCRLSKNTVLSENLYLYLFYIQEFLTQLNNLLPLLNYGISNMARFGKYMGFIVWKFETSQFFIWKVIKMSTVGIFKILIFRLKMEAEISNLTIDYCGCLGI